MPDTYTKEQIDKARETLKKCIEIEGQYETGPYRCKQETLGGYVYVSKGVFTVSLTTERDIILSALSTAEQERDALKARVAELEGGLVDAIKSIDEGGAHSVKRIRKMLIEVLGAIVGKKED